MYPPDLFPCNTSSTNEWFALVSKEIILFISLKGRCHVVNLLPVHKVLYRPGHPLGFYLHNSETLHLFNGLFTLPDSDWGSNSDLDSKSDGYIAIYGSFHTARSQIQIQILSANYKDGTGIRVNTRVRLLQRK